MRLDTISSRDSGSDTFTERSLRQEETKRPPSLSFSSVRLYLIVELVSVHWKWKPDFGFVTGQIDADVIHVIA